MDPWEQVLSAVAAAICNVFEKHMEISHKTPPLEGASFQQLSNRVLSLPAVSSCYVGEYGKSQPCGFKEQMQKLAQAVKQEQKTFADMISQVQG